jgi:plastocyanin
MRRKLVSILAAIAAVTALVVATTGQAAPAAKLKLTGTDGPGFTISMAKKSVKAGTYDITIRDRSNIHNFHLTGPGLNKTTGVSAVGTVVWKNVKLKKGTYRFVCDPHAGNMKGTLKVT